MTIVITGANGFIGKKLVQAFSTSNSQLILVDLNLPQITSNGFWYLPKDFLEFLEEPINAQNIEIILHFGAISDAQSLEHDLINFYNTSFTNTLASHASRFNIPFVFASSMSVYGQFGNSLDSTNLLPYAQSKRESEKYIEALGILFSEWPWFILRLSNIFGFDEFSKKHMASIPFRFTLDAINSSIIHLWHIRVNNSQMRIASRDFLFIDDLLVQLKELLKRFPTSGTFDLGTGASTSLKDIALVVSEITKANICITDLPNTISRDRYQLFTRANMSWMEKPFVPSLTIRDYVVSLHEMMRGS